jgi:hypothetical protein
VKTLNVALNLTILTAAIVGPPVAIWYILKWLGWALNHRPKTAWAVIVFLLAALVLAAATFHGFFPYCRVGFHYRTVCVHDQL